MVNEFRGIKCGLFYQSQKECFTKLMMLKLANSEIYSGPKSYQ